jgi:hypothetical protein
MTRFALNFDTCMLHASSKVPLFKVLSYTSYPFILKRLFSKNVSLYAWVTLLDVKRSQYQVFPQIYLAILFIQAYCSCS